MRVHGRTTVRVLTLNSIHCRQFVLPLTLTASVSDSISDSHSVTDTDTDTDTVTDTDTLTDTDITEFVSR